MRKTFPPKVQRDVPLERRIFLLLSKEKNEEMEIKDTHMYVHICKQRELATDRWDCFAVRMAWQFIGITTTISLKTGFPLNVNLLSNISWSRLGCKIKNKVIVDLHQKIISLHFKCTYHIRNVCDCHVTLNAVICDNLGQELNCPELTRHTCLK